MTEPNPYISALDFWPPAVAVFGGNIILFIIAQIKKDNSIIDTAWGLIFIIPNLIILIRNGNWHWRTILNLTLVSIWGLRLAIHIGVRHPGKEDFRYQDMRKGWEARGKGYYYFAAFTYVFMMQALFSLIVGSSALFSSIWSYDTGVFVTDFVGLALWVFGFVFEIIGDWQL